MWEKIEKIFKKWGVIRVKIRNYFDSLLTKMTVGTALVIGFLFLSTITPFILFGNGIHLNSKISLNSPKSEETPINPFDRLQLKGAGIAIYDPSSDKFLYTKNGSSQLPLASITKVMSSVSALRIAERINSEEPIKFAGKWWDLKDLVQFALVSSSNAGVANIADAMEKINNSEKYNDISDKKILFMNEMKDATKELGLDQTYFLNETGLDINEKIAGAYGSAKDVAKMFAYAINKYPTIFGATKYPEIKITSEDGEERGALNTNIDVNKMTALIASKTGTTDLAGGNLVIAFDAGLSHPIIITVLGSTPEDRFSDVEKLADATVEVLSR